MNEDELPAALVAMQLAVFKRQLDGSFVPIVPIPDWLARITSDTTFPFLGHILEEAGGFWLRGLPGSRQWGPCAEVGESGEEYHYMVSALLVENGQYLVFNLDSGADRVREVLQKVRSEALSAERDAASFRAIVADMRRTNRDVKELLRQLVVSDLTPGQLELVNSLAAKCVALMGGASSLVRATTLPRV